jgi:hypothetical protein
MARGYVAGAKGLNYPCMLKMIYRYWFTLLYWLLVNKSWLWKKMHPNYNKNDKFKR